QRSLDPASTLQNRGDLARRDTSAVAVREPQIDLAERARRRASAAVDAPRLQETEHDRQRILDGDASPENHRGNRVRRHACSLGSSTRSRGPYSRELPRLRAVVATLTPTRPGISTMPHIWLATPPPGMSSVSASTTCSELSRTSTPTPTTSPATSPATETDA